MLGVSSVGVNPNYVIGKNNSNLNVESKKIEAEKISKHPCLSSQVHSNISFGRYLRLKYITPDGIVPDLNPFKEAFKVAQKKLRHSEKDSSWINLPKKLLDDKTIDKIYETVEKFKKPFGDDYHVLFVGLGNPSSADEAAEVLGYGHKLTYCCGTMKEEIAQSINKAGKNLDKIFVNISSSSGKTEESKVTTKLLINAFTKHYKDKGLSPKEVKKEVAKHFICLTDKNPKATLKKMAIKNNYATIDCVNGESGFADIAYDIPLLALLGMPKETALNIVKTADKASKHFLNNRFKDNLAAKFAAYDKLALDHKAKKEQIIGLNGLVKLTSKFRQIYCEHLKLVGFDTAMFPRNAHDSLQVRIDKNLHGQPKNNITNITINKKPYRARKLEDSHIEDAKKQGHYQKVLTLASGNGAIKPEAYAEFVMLKNFVAFYKNEIQKLRQDLYDKSFVDGYKKIFKNSLGADKGQ